jgi:hypothetical protein
MLDCDHQNNAALRIGDERNYRLPQKRVDQGLVFDLKSIL